MKDGEEARMVIENKMERTRYVTSRGIVRVGDEL